MMIVFDGFDLIVVGILLALLAVCAAVIVIENAVKKIKGRRKERGNGYGK